ncbi:MFS-type transporter SLC18B1-like [Watersipora subatra]|uniref:MFS-type transporter SLC18B1-like n=1 Tax=Watersipora subatra TaxID=2589382 RepID=UPI00355B99CF
MQRDESANTEEYERLFTEITESGSTEELPQVKDKHNSMVVIIIALIFLSFCIDTLLFPFFPDVALSKGLLQAEIGIVFSAFDLARFVTAPITGSMAFVETGNMVGYALGPALGALLYQHVNSLIAYLEMNALKAGPHNIAVSRHISAYLGVFRQEKTKNSSKDFLSFLTIPGLFIMFLIWVTIKLSETSRTTELTQFYYISFGTAPSTIGILYSIWALISTVGIAVVTKIANKKNAPYLLLATWMIIVPLWLTVMPSPPVSYFFGGKRYFMLTSITMAMMSFFASALYILPFSIALRLACINGYPENSLHTYGLLTGLMNSGLCLGSTVGPILTGVIVDNVGFELTQTLAASITTLTVGITHI